MGALVKVWIVFRYIKTKPAGVASCGLPLGSSSEVCCVWRVLPREPLQKSDCFPLDVGLGPGLRRNSCELVLREWEGFYSSNATYKAGKPYDRSICRYAVGVQGLSGWRKALIEETDGTHGVAVCE